MLLTKLLSQPEIWENLENTIENSLKFRTQTFKRCHQHLQIVTNLQSPTSLSLKNSTQLGDKNEINSKYLMCVIPLEAKIVGNSENGFWDV